MTEQTQKEITKSFAYGMNTEEVSTSYGISLEEADKFAAEHFEKIAERKEQLERDGWL